MEEYVYPGSLEEWRAWLSKNHDKKKKVFLIKNKKHTGKFTFNGNDAMDEAICFGWIDTTVRRRDENTYVQCFARRSKNSKWSENTLSYGKRLIEEGRMFPAGLKFYEEGLLKKTHDHGIPKNPEMPEELKNELDKKKNKSVKEKFEKLAPSYKRTYYRWILHGKQKETRVKRALQAVEQVRKGVKFGASAKDV